MKRYLALVLVLALAGVAASAQEKKAEKKSGAKSETAAPAAKSNPEMARLLKMFSGNWVANVKFEPSPMAPKGGTGKASAVFKAGPGGNSMIEEYTGNNGPMGPFHGLGVTWWDANAGAFKGTWCDSMAQTCMVGGMKWQGDKIVGIPQTMDMGGQQTVITSEYRDLKPGSITYSMGAGPTAEQAKTTFTIVYTKPPKAKSEKPAAKKEADPAKN